MAHKSWTVQVVSATSGEEVGSFEVPPPPAGLNVLCMKIAKAKGILDKQVTLLHEQAELTRWTTLPTLPEALHFLVVPAAHAEIKQQASSLLRELELSPSTRNVERIDLVDWSVIGLDRVEVLDMTLNKAVVEKIQRYLDRRERIVSLLLGKRATVERPTETIQPLHRAVAISHAPTVEVLLNARASPDTGADEDGRSALELAASFGSRESCAVARLLLQHGARVDRPARADTALHAAAASGYLPTVELLITAVADVNRVGRAERAALQFAAIAGAGDVVTALIRAKAEVQRRDKNRKEALQYAVSSDDVQSVSALLDAGAGGGELKIGNRPLLHYALAASTEEMVEYILSRKADVNARDAHGRLPLLVAAARSDASFAELMYRKASHSQEVVDESLCAAAEKCNSAVVRFLLQRRADPTARSHTTALHLAAAAGDEIVVRDLLYAKANPHCRDGNSKIPWDVCKRRKNAELAQLLKPGK